jgi:hypothetical protein
MLQLAAALADHFSADLSVPPANPSAPAALAELLQPRVLPWLRGLHPGRPRAQALAPALLHLSARLRVPLCGGKLVRDKLIPACRLASE